MGAVRIHKPFHGRHHIEPDGAAQAAVLQWRFCPLYKRTVPKNPAQDNVALKEIVMHNHGVSMSLLQADGGFLTALSIERTDKG
jgi:hypothetical protein